MNADGAQTRQADVAEGYRYGPTDTAAPARRVPVLSEATRARIVELAGTYPRRRTALLPALKVAQDEVGYLPPHVVAEVADLVRLPHAAAQELVAFYTMLHPVQEGRTRVVVCAQLPCALQGAEQLLRDLGAGLGIAAGETTADGRVTLERTSECFGACHRAPMARVGDEYVENLDAVATARLLERLKATGTAADKGRPGA